MYDTSDPRAALMKTAKPTGPFCPPQPGDFSQIPADETGPSHKAWYWRAQAVCVMCIELDGELTIQRPAQLDEYVALTLDDITLDITAGETRSVPGNHLTIIPPGASTITARGTGTLSLMFSPRAADIASKCRNTPEPNPRIPAFQPWPDPPEGFKIRAYNLDIPPEQGRFGRIFRCTTMMVNVLDPRMGPRDRTKVSPHHHDDFEQISLALKGAFCHLMRWPWTPNMDHWREDMAIDVGSPSATVIPPPAIHTSLSTDPGENQLIDIFAPPRLDFSLKPGWVLNAADYPLPAHARGQDV
jgi:hypothetical protein